MRNLVPQGFSDPFPQLSERFRCVGLPFPFRVPFVMPRRFQASQQTITLGVSANEQSGKRKQSYSRCIKIDDHPCRADEPYLFWKVPFADKQV